MSEANVTALVATQPQPRREVRVVSDPIPVLDTAKFEHMQRVANVMAYSSLVPRALTHVSEGDGEQRQLVALTPQEIVSNCFLVVNQAVRWGMDPFAVAQCVSVVHGKLCYEGKLIAAVINAKLGYDLEYAISGKDDDMAIVVTAALDGKAVLDSKGQPKCVEGTVAEWKTTGNRSPWGQPGGKPRMLRYRGAREWCRVHAPALMLGVYSDDEMEILTDNADRRGHSARDVTYEESRPAISGPPRRVPTNDEPKPEQEAESSPAAPVDVSKPAETQVTKPVTSGPPRHVPEKKQEAVTEAAQESGAMPERENAQAFLIWVEDHLATIKDADEMAEFFNTKVEDNLTSDTYESAKSLYNKYLKKLDQK